MLKLLFIAYLAGQALDTSTTVYAFRHGFTEANPTLAWAPEKPVLFIGFKTGLGAAGVWASYSLHKKHPKAAKLALAAVAGSVWYAGLHNLRALRR